MGFILDSSLLVAEERTGSNARQALSHIAKRLPGEDIAISVITLMELAHGVARADTPQRKATRQQFLHELAIAIPVHPITVSLALRAGRLDGESLSKGFRIPVSDLLIGVLALELGYAVATANPRHFRMIPVLDVVGL